MLQKRMRRQTALGKAVLLLDEWNWRGRANLTLRRALLKAKQVLVRNFDADDLFSSVARKALFEKHGLGRLGDQSAAGGKMKVTRAVMSFHTFSDQSGIAAHTGSFRAHGLDGQWYDRFCVPGWIGRG
jgi:hypothetical protein